MIAPVRHLAGTAVVDILGPSDDCLGGTRSQYAFGLAASGGSSRDVPRPDIGGGDLVDWQDHPRHARCHGSPVDRRWRRQDSARCLSLPFSGQSRYGTADLLYRDNPATG
jgi:hypothetical protein